MESMTVLKNRFISQHRVLTQMLEGAQEVIERMRQTESKIMERDEAEGN